ncbi:unnamed protein product [Brassica oleracea var. botrytis]
MKSKLNISFSKSLSRKRTDDSLCFWSVFFCNFCFSKSFSLQTVYKGRKKKTIEYFQGSSREILTWILTKFGISSLHSLNHPNVLKFNACYHLINYLPLSIYLLFVSNIVFLWFSFGILRWGGGGAYLRTLLQQDCKLPEDSVYGLAYDLVIALLFLHSKQITYCDLKPSNILLDENGHIKLCDFGLILVNLHPFHGLTVENVELRIIWLQNYMKMEGSILLLLSSDLWGHLAVFFI